MLQNLQIIVRLDGVPDDRALQPLQRLPISLHIPRDLPLAVQVEGPPLHALHDVLDLDVLAVEEPIPGLGEAVLERRRLLVHGRVLGDGGSQLEALQGSGGGAFEGRDGDSGNWVLGEPVVR